MRKEVFYPNCNRIVLKRECITAFRPLNNDPECTAVECDIEERQFSTKYELKVIPTHADFEKGSHFYFTQVLRKG